MPAETARLQRRMTGRDRWFLVALACVALVGTPAAIVLSSHGSAPAPDAGCVTTLRASIVGGANVRYCGADAAMACQRFAADDGRLAEQCDRLVPSRRPEAK